MDTLLTMSKEMTNQTTPDAENTEEVTLRLPKSVLEEINSSAKSIDVSPEELIVKVLKQSIDKAKEAI